MRHVVVRGVRDYGEHQHDVSAGFFVYSLPCALSLLIFKSPIRFGWQYRHFAYVYQEPFCIRVLPNVCPFPFS